VQASNNILAPNGRFLSFDDDNFNEWQRLARPDVKKNNNKQPAPVLQYSINSFLAQARVIKFLFFSSAEASERIDEPGSRLSGNRPRFHPLANSTSSRRTSAGWSFVFGVYQNINH
jgi:hypothetical protein